MKRKKIAGLFLALSMVLSLTAGCGSKESSTAETQQASGTVAEEDAGGPEEEAVEGTVEETSEDQAAAEQLLVDLTGTYQELWPVILADEYAEIWLDASAELVGEENAEAAYAMLASMVTGEVYGEEAVEAYKDGGSAYFCGFTQTAAALISAALHRVWIHWSLTALRP